MKSIRIVTLRATICSSLRYVLVYTQKKSDLWTFHYKNGKDFEFTCSSFIKMQCSIFSSFLKIPSQISLSHVYLSFSSSAIRLESYRTVNSSDYWTRIHLLNCEFFNTLRIGWFQTLFLQILKNLNFKISSEPSDSSSKIS